MKRLLNITLILTLILGTNLPLFKFELSKSYAASTLTGSGTLSDPYRIYNVNDLQSMKDDLSASYILMNDINASSTSSWNSGAGFAPIGNSVNRFTGNFNGNGYTISNFTINRPGTSYIGLFGFNFMAT